MNFIKLNPEDKAAVDDMSRMATAIVREHYDPILGTEQNDYMLEMFQSPTAISDQLAHGYQYYTASVDGRAVGFIAFVQHEDCLYLSKFYLYAHERRKGFGREMMAFVADEARKASLPRVELNVNRFNDAVQAYEHLGLRRVRLEKNDIGHGYYMDDYVYGMDV